MLSNEDPDYRKSLEYSLRFCGYRERSKKEVLDKLISKNYEKELIQKVINRLEDLGAIDNLRFAKAFARGKNRSNRWGKIKIRQHLFHKGLNEIEINEGIDSIDEADYFKVLEKNIEIYLNKHINPDKYKLISHLLSKGFSSEEVAKSIKL